MNEKLWYLKDCDFFELLSENELRQIEARCKSRFFARQSPIYLPADDANAVFLMASGQAKICHLTANGKQSILTFIEPGELFGELALFEADRRGEYAEAVEASTVIMIPSGEVHGLMERHATVPMSITRNTRPLDAWISSCHDTPSRTQIGGNPAEFPEEQRMGLTTAIVMAAGKGTRMKSDLPKVLHQVRGRPMIEFVLDTLEAAGVDRIIVVVGYQADNVRQTLSHRKNLIFVEQTEQLGTGHAVMVCREHLEGHEGPVLIVTGDSPMIQKQSVGKLLEDFADNSPACILGTLHKEDPTGLGRIVRDSNNNFEGIVEEKDATDEQRRITEVNMSTYVFDCKELLYALDRLGNDNSQGEYYITDCPGILRDEQKEVHALPVLMPCESLSINNVDELQIVDSEMQKMGY